MTDLFESQQLSIIRPSPQPEFEFRAPDGTLLASGTQVGGPRQGSFGRLLHGFATQDRSQTVVQVSRPDGTRLFTIDRTADDGLGTYVIGIVAADGSVIGVVQRGVWQTDLRGRTKEQGGGSDVGWRLLGPAGEPLSALVWEERVYAVGGTTTDGGLGRMAHPIAGGSYADYLDPEGTVLARGHYGGNRRRKAELTLTLHYRVPEPLRTLLIASPVAVNLSGIGAGRL